MFESFILYMEQQQGFQQREVFASKALHSIVVEEIQLL
jgi:hypothetical protein